MTVCEPVELPSKPVIPALMLVSILAVTVAAEAESAVAADFASVEQLQLAIHAATTQVAAVVAAEEQWLQHLPAL